MTKEISEVVDSILEGAEVSKALTELVSTLPKDKLESILYGYYFHPINLETTYSQAIATYQVPLGQGFTCKKCGAQVKPDYSKSKQVCPVCGAEMFTG